MKATRAQRLAAFEAAKAKTIEIVERLVAWEDVGLSDDEIHEISDAAVEAAINVNPAGEDK